MLKEDPMAQEICDVLREWCNAWKRHYMVVNNSACMCSL